MLNPDRIMYALILLITSCTRLAGELRLNNGAVLPGELGSIGATALVWKADKIGDVTVSKSDVIHLQTSSLAAMAGAPHEQAQKNRIVGVQHGL